LRGDVSGSSHACKSPVSTGPALAETHLSRRAPCLETAAGDSLKMRNTALNRLDDQLPCASREPDLFFPPAYGAANRQAVEVAKALCAVCSSKPRCLSEALARDEQYGIWGGTTPHERLRIRAKSRFPALSVG